jgi:hypothetical protein
MLNWRWDTTQGTPSIVAASVPYTVESWNVTSATIYNTLANEATDKEMANPATRNVPQNVDRIRVGDIVASANLKKWPGDPAKGHAEIITKVRINDATGKKEVYLATLGGQGQWAEIGALLQIYKDGTDPYLSQGSQYVMRSIDYMAFNKLADALEGKA